MNIVGKDITFTRDATLKCGKDGEVFIPAGTRLIIDKAAMKKDRIVLSVHEDKEVSDGN